MLSVDESWGSDHRMYWMMIKIVHLDRFVHTGASAKIHLLQKGLVGAFEAYDAEFARHIMALGTEGVVANGSPTELCLGDETEKTIVVWTSS